MIDSKMGAQNPTMSRLLILLGGLAACVAAGMGISIRNPSVVAVPVIFAIAIVVFLFPRAAVYLAFVILLVEGFLRNLIDNPGVLLAKDALLILLYARYFGGRILRGSKPLPAHPLNLPIFIFAGVVILESLNPGVVSIMQVPIGIRTWLLYIPLFWVAADLFSDPAERRRFVHLYLIGAIPVCVLAWSQYIVGPQAYASLGSAFERSTFVLLSNGGTESVYRPNSTFSYSSHFALYLGSVAFLITALLLGARGRRRPLMMGLLVLLAVTILLENQRVEILLLPPLLGFILVRRRGIPQLALIVVACVLGVAAVAAAGSNPNDRLSTLGRVGGIFSNQDRILTVRGTTYIDQTVSTIRDAPLGNGTGSTSIGSRYLLGDIPLFVEVSFAKVAGDLGVIGLGAYIWMFWAIFRSSLRVDRIARLRLEPELANLAVSIGAYQLFIGYVGYDLAVGGLTFWFFSGLVNPIRLTGIGSEKGAGGGSMP